MANEGAAAVVDDKGNQPAAGAESKPGAKPEGGQPNPENRPGQEPKPGQKEPDGDAKYRGIVADLQKERKARQEEATRRTTLETELATVRKQIQALTGASPKSESETEVEEIRAHFGKIFERLSRLDSPETFEQIEKLLKMLPVLEQTTQHYWGRHGTTVLTQIEKKVAEEIGGELTPRQIKRLRSAYVLEAETNPEFARRHEEDPDGLVAEFAKEWIEDWFEPSRRKATADEVARHRKVPSARDRNLVTGPGEKPIDVNDPKAVEDVLVAGFKQRGGQFGR